MLREHCSSQGRRYAANASHEPRDGMPPKPRSSLIARKEQSVNRAQDLNVVQLNFEEEAATVKAANMQQQLAAGQTQRPVAAQTLPGILAATMPP